MATLYWLGIMMREQAERYGSNLPTRKKQLWLINCDQKTEKLVSFLLSTKNVDRATLFCTELPLTQLFLTFESYFNWNILGVCDNREYSAPLPSGSEGV